MPAANASAWRDRGIAQPVGPRNRRDAPIRASTTSEHERLTALPHPSSDGLRPWRGSRSDRPGRNQAALPIRARESRRRAAWPSKDVLLEPALRPAREVGGSRRGQAPPRQTRPRRRGTARHTRERHPVPELSRAVGSTRSPAPSAGQAWRRCHSTVVLHDSCGARFADSGLRGFLTAVGHGVTATERHAPSTTDQSARGIWGESASAWSRRRHLERDCHSTVALRLTEATDHEVVPSRLRDQSENADYPIRCRSLWRRRPRPYTARWSSSYGRHRSWSRPKFPLVR
jgi:hypothetical protein